MTSGTDLNILRNNHTFGLNAAYRAYEKYNFYPTYFGCFDYKVCEYHKKNFSKLINKKGFLACLNEQLLSF